MVEDLGINFSKQDDKNGQINSLTREKTIPVNQSKIVSYQVAFGYLEKTAE
jgi:hypothetical protein